MNLVGTTFNEYFPGSTASLAVADKEEAITVECMADGLLSMIIQWEL